MSDLPRIKKNIKASIDSTSGRKSLYDYVIDLNDVNREVLAVISIDECDAKRH